MPWSPPEGGEYCNLCYEDGLGCSKYACESLGTACRFINEGTSFEECSEIENDLISPKISPWEEVVTEGYRYEDVSDDGFRIVSETSEDGCVRSFSAIRIGLSLDEPGRCTFRVDKGVYDPNELIGWLEEGSDYDPEDFDLGNDFLGSVDEEDSTLEEFEGLVDPFEGSEEFYFGGHTTLMHNHTHDLYFPTLSSLHVTGFDPNVRKDFDLKIRCEDFHENKNPKDYIIRTCIMPELDVTAPKILDYDPKDGLFVYDAETFDFAVYVDEPAECKWSLENKEYDLMEREFDCYNDPVDGLIARAGGSFKCTSDITTNKQSETIYVKCKDQPWLKNTENASDRHVTETGYQINLSRTLPLVIDEISPKDGDVVRDGTEPATLDVKVKTSGGGYDGDAICKYLMFGTVFADLRETGGTTHEDSFNRIYGGDKKLLIKCEDSVGNKAYENSSFTVEIDRKAPNVVRIFRKDNSLRLITEEKAACYYDYNSCNFNTDNASSMSIGLSTVHNAKWSPGVTYYIKCEDSWGNWDSRCSVIVKPEELI
jgi:hypothetical protein